MKCRPNTTDGVLWDLIGHDGRIVRHAVPFDVITVHSTKGGHDIQRDLVRVLFTHWTSSI